MYRAMFHTCSTDYLMHNGFEHRRPQVGRPLPIHATMPHHKPPPHPAKLKMPIPGQEAKSNSLASPALPTTPHTTPTTQSNKLPQSSVQKQPSTPSTPPTIEAIVNMLDRIAERTSFNTPEEAQNVAITEMLRLGSAQREIIKETFFIMEKEAIKNGLQILIMLFSEHPRYKNIWPQFRAIPDSALMSAIELRKHASTYMAGLRTIIDAMDDDASLATVLKRIARAHIKWQIMHSHIMHMVVPVIEVVRQTSGRGDEDTRQAWITLYDIIANLVDVFRERERRTSLNSK